MDGFETLTGLPDKERQDPGVLGWDLGRVRRLLDGLGRPDEGLRTVLVAGSKGKGSTAAMIAAAAQAGRWRVGLYTQPHLHRYGERIRIDGRPLEAEEARSRLGRVLAAAGEPVTAFEIATALALLTFAEARTDLAVLEVGLGGRRDATNVVAPDLCVFTPIEAEHTDLLGPDAEAVAAEKAGIVRAGVLALSAPQAAGVEAVLAAACARLGSPLLRVASGPHGPRSALRGWYQRGNAALAAAASLALGVPPAAVRAGLAGVRWPGRLEVIARSPITVADGAHTPLSARALVRALREEFGPWRADRTALVVGLAADKDLERVAAVLGRACRRAFAVATGHPRSRAAAQVARALADHVPTSVVASAAEALERARRWAGPDGLVCATGSLRVAAAAREAAGCAVAPLLTYVPAAAVPEPASSGAQDAVDLGRALAEP